MNKKTTRRSFGRRALAFGIAMFAMVTLTAVGFAAWLISSDSTASAEGSVNTEVVNYANVTLKILNEQGGNLYEYGGTNEPDISKPYDIYFSIPSDAKGLVSFNNPKVNDKQGTDKGEQLSFKFVGEVGNIAKIKSLSFALKLPDAIIEAAGYTKDNGNWTITEAGLANAYIELPSYALDSDGKKLPLVSGGTIQYEDEAKTKLKYTSAVTFASGDFTDNGTTENGVTVKKDGDNGTFEAEWSFKWGARYNCKNPAEIFNQTGFADQTDKDAGKTGIVSGNKTTKNQVFLELLKLQAAVNDQDLANYISSTLTGYVEQETTESVSTVDALTTYVANAKNDPTAVGNELNIIQTNLTTVIGTSRQQYTLYIEASAN